MWCTFFAAFLLPSLVACQFITGTKTAEDNPTPNTLHSAGNVLVPDTIPKVALEDVSLRFSPLSPPQEGDSVLTIENKPTWMRADTVSGEIVGVPNEGPQVYSGISIKVSRQGKILTVGPFDLEVKGDPLKKYAWHLRNNGQTVFSQSAGLSGFDVKINQTIASGITGKGVRVAISDSGSEWFHEDLQDNYLPEESRDYRTGDEASAWKGDPTAPRNDETITEPSHGTSVAGVIAAVGWNGIGSRGVAPRVHFAAFNFIPADQSTSDAEHQIANSQYLHQITGNFDVYNQSWGSASASFLDDSGTSLLNQYSLGLKHEVNTARENRGSVYTRAAGNEFQYPYQGFPEHFGVSREGFDTEGYFDITSNLDADNTLPYFIVAGALDASGTKASYSSQGSNLWVTAPGGEDGLNEPAILSTDRVGCEKGYSLTFDAADAALYTLFNQGADPLNSKCNYNDVFNGTSSATPMVTGSVALLLEVNPSLTWRDVKYILAKTAIPVEPSKADIQRSAHTFTFRRYKRDATGHLDPNFSVADATTFTNGNLTVSDPPGYMAVQGWKTNAAGFAFHNYYGFGRINVDGARELAKNYTSPYAGKAFEEVEVRQNVSPSLLIPNAGTTVNTSNCHVNYACLEVPIAFNQDLIVESVRLKVMIDQTNVSGDPVRDMAYPGEIGIELVSPSGTLSKLQTVNNALLGAQIEDASVGVNNPEKDPSSGKPVTTRWYGAYYENQFPQSGFPLLSNAFFQEPAKGTWTLRLIDGLKTGFVYNWAVTNATTGAQSHTFTRVDKTGKLTGYSLTVYGHVK